MRRILYLRIPYFHSAVHALLDPQLRAQPLLVAAGSYQQGVVIAVSPEAEQAGAARGMSWRHARRRCPEARLIRYDRETYLPVLEQLGNVVARTTPWVERLGGAEDEFFASLGQGDLKEGMDLARRIRAHLHQELGLRANLGLASGKITARAVCLEAEKSAGDPSSPPPAAYVPQGKERLFLRGLAVEYLWELKPEAFRRLRLLGLQTLGQIGDLPARTLVHPLGPGAHWYQKLARGVDPRRVAVWQPSPVESAACFVEESEPDRALLDGCLRKLAQRTASALQREGRYGRSVAVTVHLSGGRRLFFIRHLKEPGHLWHPIFQTARSLLDFLETPAEGGAPGIEALELAVGGLASQGAIQLSIFGDEDRSLALRCAIARLQTRFGERAIGTADALEAGSGA